MGKDGIARVSVRFQKLVIGYESVGEESIKPVMDRWDLVTDNPAWFLEAPVVVRESFIICTDLAVTEENFKSFIQGWGLCVAAIERYEKRRNENRLACITGNSE